MTDEELIQKFNPATAGGLTDADLAIMRGLTTEQIAVLAKAYPNNGHQRPYLLLADASLPENKQLFPLSTWQNLHSLHKFHSKTNFSAYTFKALFKPAGKIPTIAGVRSDGPGGKVVDLSSKQAADLLRENFGGEKAPAIEAKKPVKPAAKPNPKAPAKTVDVAGKTTSGKGAVTTVPADGEEMQDFSE